MDFYTLIKSLRDIGRKFIIVIKEGLQFYVKIVYLLYTE